MTVHFEIQVEYRYPAVFGWEYNYITFRDDNGLIPSNIEDRTINSVTSAKNTTPEEVELLEVNYKEF